MRLYPAVDFSNAKAVGVAADGSEHHGSVFSFLATFNIAPELIEAATSIADREGVSVDEALLAYGLMDETLFYQCLARHLGVPFTSELLLLDVGAAYGQAAEAGVARIAYPDRVAFLSAPRGEKLSALLRMKAANGRAPSQLAITTPRLFAQSVRHSAQKRITADASFALMSADMNFSARSRTNSFQMMLAFGSFLPLSFGLYWVPIATALFAAFALAMVFFSAVLYRLFVAAAAMGAERRPYPPLADGDLPRYTIVVALHREARICRQLVERLERIDYPRSKLDIKFVIEDDDIETRLALKASKLPPIYEIIIAPPGQPRTKPRALNIALPFARGDYLCIYDAEDAPDADQLRCAAAQFATSSDSIACLQAKLVVDNVDDTWLTKLFAIEYAALFEVQNVGLADCRHALPLGGSSNHFRLSALRHVMGWDAWNVTEDADLGFRLARFGYETSMLQSSTREEALGTLAAWLKQRRRWCKGWLQTGITLTRQPFRLARDLGAKRMGALVLLLTGLILGPLFWIPSGGLLLWQFLTSRSPLAADPTGGLLPALWTSVAVLGAASMLFPAWLGLRRQGLTHLWPLLPCLFLYSVLHSLAASLAIYDLFRNPFHWHKTEHGLAKTSASEARVKAPSRHRLAALSARRDSTGISLIAKPLTLWRDML